MHRQCPACGAYVEERDRFCAHCGAVIAPADLMPAQQTAPGAGIPVQRLVPGPATPSVPASQHLAAHQSWSGVVAVSPSPPPTVVFSPQTRQHSFVVRALWYLFIGWWLSGIVVVLGYILTFTLIGMPLGFYLFNRIPEVLTLRARTTAFRTEVRNGVTYVVESELPQRPWYVRAPWFVFIGWWLGALWLTAAWLISILVITLPIGIWMFNRTSGVMTLQRH